ncbi:MAG: hypothetical protein AAF206_08505 [Bacteroidota bacterium]
MKYTFIILLLTTTFFLSTNAQQINRTEEYCSVEVECIFQKGNIRSYGALVDYGQPVERRGIGSILRARRITDESGERTLFNSAIDILNYMNSDGWELVEVIVKDDDNREFIMKRKVSPGSRLAADR